MIVQTEPRSLLAANGKLRLQSNFSYLVLENREALIQAVNRLNTPFSLVVFSSYLPRSD